MASHVSRVYLRIYHSLLNDEVAFLVEPSQSFITQFDISYIHCVINLRTIRPVILHFDSVVQL